jgi:hypothetical protein
VNRREARYIALCRAWLTLEDQRGCGFDDDGHRPEADVMKIADEFGKIIERLADQWYALRPNPDEAAT